MKSLLSCGLAALMLNLVLAPALPAKPAETPPGLRVVKNLDYAGAGNSRQMLDLYLPEKASEKPRPLLVYIHGGGWEEGSKDDGAAFFPLLADGRLAAASIGYRLTDQAHWPEQIFDCKAALRWLHAHAKEYGYDPDRIGLFGISAGGHLVSLLGTSAGVAELEGAIGGAKEPPVKIKCVANFCGPADFITFGNASPKTGAENPKGPIAKLLGGTVKDRQAEAKAASPVTYVTADDPPFLHIHGTKDPLVPYAQVLEFDAQLKKAHVPSTVLTGTDAGHVFFSGELVQDLRTFFARHLLDGTKDVTEGPVATK